MHASRLFVASLTRFVASYKLGARWCVIVNAVCPKAIVAKKSAATIIVSGANFTISTAVWGQQSARSCHKTDALSHAAA